MAEVSILDNLEILDSALVKRRKKDVLFSDYLTVNGNPAGSPNGNPKGIFYS